MDEVDDKELVTSGAIETGDGNDDEQDDATSNDGDDDRGCDGAEEG